MRQLIILSVVLTAALADMEYFNGKWTAVMQFPENIGVPTCLQYIVSKNPQNCVCADGSVISLLDFDYRNFESENEVRDTAPGYKKSFPALETGTAEGATQASRVSCTCGNILYPSRLLLRRINDDYFILYESNRAVLNGRTVQNASKIQEVANQIDDLSGRRGKVICSPV